LQYNRSKKYYTDLESDNKQENYDFLDIYKDHSPLVRTAKAQKVINMIKWDSYDSISVSAGDSYNNIIHSLNRIIIINPNAKLFDILKKIKEENIVISPELLSSLRIEGSKWYKNGNDFYPDCCDIAFECGYQIDYLIVNKKEECFFVAHHFVLNILYNKK